jgi:arabinose-5-phosphate isomerase
LPKVFRLIVLLHRVLVDILEIAKATILSQTKELNALTSLLNDDFVKAVQFVHQCNGRLIVSGIGKSAIIAQKIVATCNSTGTPAFYMHAADAIHGDLGMIQSNDCVMIISKSGESDEVVYLAQLVKKFGNQLIALCGNAQSKLVASSDYFLNCTVQQEACPNNLAPTTSTSAQLIIGDAFAICLLQLNGFTTQDFARIHPGGALGKQLYLQVSDISKKNANPQVALNASIREVILSISSNRLGATAVVENNKLQGIITDGDLRRMMEKSADFTSLCAKDIMNATPKTIASSELAINALAKMRTNNISQLVVLQDEQAAGFVHLHDLIKEGLI